MSDPVSVGLGALTLAAAVFLLVMAYGLERVTPGSAMGDNVRWVMLGAICIAANVLVVWVARLVPEEEVAALVRQSADGLMILGLVFLCVYFFRVRAAMLRFVTFARSSEELFAQVQVADIQADVDGETSGSAGGRWDPMPTWTPRTRKRRRRTSEAWLTSSPRGSRRHSGRS